MKKLIIVIMLLAAFSLVACTRENQPDYTAHMVQLETPIKNTNGVWMSHEYILNDKETLYFAPESFQVGDQKYVNINKEGYYLKSSNWYGISSWDKVDNEYLQKVFPEGVTPND